MIGPQELDSDILNELGEESIAVDKWGNEWDSTGEFNDMDFRLVDDE